MASTTVRVRHRAWPLPPACRRCSCGCSHFNSAFLCLVCDKHWEEHETVFEEAFERIAASKPVGERSAQVVGNLVRVHEHHSSKFMGIIAICHIIVV